MFKPHKFNSIVQRNEILVSSRTDKKGNVFFLVEYYHPASDVPLYACFEKLSSALDFIHSNFE